MRGASLFGGSWINGSNAGSRYANLDYWPENSDDNVGARGRSDDQFQTRQRSRPCRSAYPNPRLFSRRRAGSPQGNGGQPVHPASANTLRGPVQRGVGGTGFRAVRYPRPAAPSVSFSGKFDMGKRYRHLIGTITSDANMMEAFRLTARGKRLTPGFLEFKEFSHLNLERLATEMRRGEYEQGEPHEFVIFDPKHRVISALPFRDRIAQHALCAVIGPIFERTFLPRTYACRKGKGTHAAAMHVQADMRRLIRARPDEPLRFLKTDFSRYFASIDRAVLWSMIEAKISCAGTLRVLEAMVPRSGIGIPIGNLTSQILANVYGGAVDRFLQQQLGEQHWFRYMDDLVVLGHDSAHLRGVKEALEAFSADHLGLRFSKWSIAPVERGVNFLGYRIRPSHKLLRRDSVVRAKRKLAAYRANGDDERLSRFLAAWIGYASWADSRNLLTSLDIGGQE